MSKTMIRCKHKRWLYVPANLGIGDGELSSIEDRFLCADCGEWILMASIEIRKIINVKKHSRETCHHEIKFYTLSHTYLCLQCGHRWYPELITLEIKSYSEEDRERWDKERRNQILADYKAGEEKL